MKHIWCINFIINNSVDNKKHVELVTRKPFEESKEDALKLITTLFNHHADYVAAYADFVKPFFGKFIYKAGNSFYVNRNGMKVGV